MEILVDYETAEADVDSWLDHKRVKPRKRESNKEAIEELIDSVMYGQLKIDSDTLNITQVLDFPIGEEGSIKEIIHKPRVHVSAVNSKLKGVKAGDVDGRLLAYTSALTGKPVGVLGKLDTGDNAVAQNIAVFFL